MPISQESLDFLKEQQQRTPADTPLRQKFDKLVGELEPAEEKEVESKATKATAKKAA